ncbi:hypothetical protein QWI18_02290 [Pseudomonas sp. W2Oct36]|uniref:hypothetical protein n=2 Tax=unclassified Pseudomonas TaxID=196821 RepID=UPI0034E0A37F
MADRFWCTAIPFEWPPDFCSSENQTMISFLLGWLALSAVGTLIALAVIRTGKMRQPDADETVSGQIPVPVLVRFKP